MLRAFGQVEATRRIASSRGRERHSPGELRRTSLRASPRRAFAGSLLLLGIEFLCVGAIPALGYLYRSSLPMPEVAGAQSGSARETKPEDQLAARDLSPTEPLPRPEQSAAESSLALSEASVTAPRPSGEEDAIPGPSSTGSISEMSRNAEQTDALGAASAPDESPEPGSVQQTPERLAPRSDREAFTGSNLVDLNTASAGTLDSLGIGLVGRRVAENRPYTRPEDILTKRVLTRKDFDLIRSKVTAR
jgi:hypothetical protein